MTRKKRTIATIAAGAAWAAAFGITIATPHIDILSEHVVSRAFLLCASLAAVLTLGLWVEQSLAPIVETVFKLGMRAGRRIGRLDRAGGPFQPQGVEDSGWWTMPRVGQGQESTPPTGWRRT